MQEVFDSQESLAGCNLHIPTLHGLSEVLYIIIVHLKFLGVTDSFTKVFIYVACFDVSTSFDID